MLYNSGLKAKVKPIGFFTLLTLLVLLSILGAYKASQLLANDTLTDDAPCLV